MWVATVSRCRAGNHILNNEQSSLDSEPDELNRKKNLTIRVSWRQFLCSSMLWSPSRSSGGGRNARILIDIIFRHGISHNFVFCFSSSHFRSRSCWMITPQSGQTHVPCSILVFWLALGFYIFQWNRQTNKTMEIWQFFKYIFNYVSKLIT